MCDYELETSALKITYDMASVQKKNYVTWEKGAIIGV